LLTVPTISEAAKHMGVGERTLFRWLQQDTDFQAAYREARRQTVQHAIARIQQATGKAVTTLEGVMTNPESPSSSRVSAARVVLEMAIKAIELEDLEGRLVALELALQQRRDGYGH
jgi:hypothetical protein